MSSLAILRKTEIARWRSRALEHEGYTCWYFERDSIPGVPYLKQVGEAIEGCRAIVVVISSASLGSQQVTNEVVRAHEHGKAFVPLLVDISHTEFQARQPIWRQAIGAASSVILPPEGTSAIVAKIVSGLKALGIQPVGDQCLSDIHAFYLGITLAKLRSYASLQPPSGPSDTLLAQIRAHSEKLIEAARYNCKQLKIEWLGHESYDSFKDMEMFSRYISQVRQLSLGAFHSFVVGMEAGFICFSMVATYGMAASIGGAEVNEAQDHIEKDWEQICHSWESLFRSRESDSLRALRAMIDSLKAERAAFASDYEEKMTRMVLESHKVIGSLSREFENLSKKHHSV